MRICNGKSFEISKEDGSLTLGYFADQNHPPSPGEIQQALGRTFPLWERLIRFIETKYRVEGEWSTWGPAKFGWGYRYRVKGKSLIALYPQKDWIMVQIVLGRDQAERALNLMLSEKVSKFLRDAPQLRDGRWLAIPVGESGDAEDVEQLLQVKVELIGKEKDD